MLFLYLAFVLNFFCLWAFLARWQKKEFGGAIVQKQYVFEGVLKKFALYLTYTLYKVYSIVTEQGLYIPAGDL